MTPTSVALMRGVLAGVDYYRSGFVVSLNVESLGDEEQSLFSFLRVFVDYGAGRKTFQQVWNSSTWVENAGAVASLFSEYLGDDLLSSCAQSIVTAEKARKIECVSLFVDHLGDDLGAGQNDRKNT